MKIRFAFLGLTAVTTLVGLTGMTGCTTDDSDPGAATGGSGAAKGGGTGTGSGGAPGGGNGAGGSTSAVTAVVIPKTSPVVATFDTYDGSDATKWSFTWGADSSIGIYAGPFGYGDRESGFPETYELVEGYESTYGVRIADTLASEYGGGLGIWLSGAIDARAFDGISFWIRGSTPEATSTFTLSMYETMPATPDKADGEIGPCAGTSTTCKHPTFAAPVTDTWTEVKIPWSAFTAGDAAGTKVTPDGRNIKQFQWGAGLKWEPDASGTYAPTPAPYELEVDEVSFY